MAHMALYREWRPQSFSAVVGQTHIVQTLTNALTRQKTAHAYLFCGPRGTGKTSLAKIFAKALNCEARVGAEPCNQCERCRRITQGSSLDVLEIDAASNRGIDEIRDLREKARFAPSEGRYKVYIIDEVHMLTTEAFNALLKTLEEPPAHVVFLLATTEPHRLPLTILSRCQRFDLHRLSAEEVAGRLREVAAQERITVDEPALGLIARAAEGSLRDALGLLEQCTAFAGAAVTAGDVLALLGAVDTEQLFSLADAVLNRETDKVLACVNTVVNSGRDLRDFVWGLLRHYRNLLLLQSCGADSGLVALAAEDREQYRLQAEAYPPELLIAAIEALAEAENALRWTTQPRVLVEVALIRLSRFGPGLTLPELAARVARLEAGSGLGAAQPPAAERSPAEPPKVVLPPAGETGRPEAPAAADGTDGAVPGSEAPAVSLGQVISAWPEILEIIKKTKRPVHAFLVAGQPVGLEGSILSLNFKYSFHKEQIEKPENRAIVEKVLRNTLRANLRLQCTAEAVPSAPAETAPVPDTVAAVGPEQDEELNSTLDIFGGQFVDND